MLQQTRAELSAAGVEEGIGLALAGNWSEANVQEADSRGPELLIAITKDWKQRTALREKRLPRCRILAADHQAYLAEGHGQLPPGLRADPHNDFMPCDRPHTCKSIWCGRELHLVQFQDKVNPTPLYENMSDAGRL